MLIARPRPLLHEHILSYLVRLTQMNGYMSVVQLLQACKRPTPNNRIPAARLIFGDCTTSYICKSCKITEATIEPLLFRRTARGFCTFEDIQLPLSAINTHHLVFCPQCWAELGYTPFYHLLKPYTFCHVHQRVLVDEDNADNTLIWGNRNLGFFLENLPLYSSDNAGISGAAKRLSQTIGFLSASPRKKTIIAATPFNLHNFLLLLIFLHRFASRRDKRLTIRQTSNNHACSTAYGATSLLLEDWPAGFYELLNYFEHNPMSQKGKSGIRHCFRDLYDELYTGTYRKTPCYYFVRHWFELYINKRFTQSALNTSVKWLSCPNTQLLSQRQTLQILNWPPSRLKIYQRHGLIHPISLPQTRNSLYSKAEIQSLKKQTENYLTLIESAELLQVSEYQARKLLMDGKIEPTVSPDISTRDWIIDKPSLIGFINYLKSLSKKTLPTRFTKISLKQLMLRGHDISDVINLVLQKNLMVTHQSDTEKPYSIRQFAFFHDKQLLPKGYLTPLQAAANLKININAIYDFLKLGYLSHEQHKIERTTRPIKLIPVSSLILFKTNYALSRELNREQKRSLQLISGPGIDGTTVKLYSRKELIL